MSTVQQLLDQLNSASGQTQWHLVGSGAPIESTSVTTVADPLGIKPPQTVNRGDGQYYVVVQDNSGNQRKMPLVADPNSQVLQNASVHQGGTTTTGPLKVRQTGVNDVDTDASGKQTPRSDIYTGDLSKLDWNSGGPLADVPQTPKTPSATASLDSINAQGQVVPNGDPSAKQMRDQATGTVFNLVTDPKGELHDFGNDVYMVKPDGSKTLVGSIPEKQTSTIVPGVGLVSVDPNKPAGSRATIELAASQDVNNLGGIQHANGKTYVPIKDPTDPSKVTFVEAEGIPQDTSVDRTYDDPNSRYIQLLDKQGNLIRNVDKGPDWKPPVRVQPGTAPAADSVNPFIITLDPTTGQPVSTPNTNQIKSSQATEDLAKQLGLKVAAGSMSEDQAQKIITGAINTMNAQSSRISADAAKQQADNAGQQNAITAANNVLSNTATNASTGAGMLQNRVTSATSALSNMMGTIGSSKITDIPSDFGKNLVGGLSNWVTNMGGGDAVYETAARMVQGADPKISGDPTLAQQATQTLAQMMQQYQTQSGKPYPDVAATIAAKQSQGVNGVVAPQTVAQGQQTNVQPNPAAVAANQASPGGSAFNPQASTAVLNARGLQDNPQGRAIAAGQTPVAMQGAPTTPGLYNPAWQQGIISGVGLPSVGPNAANGFVAPPLPVPLLTPAA